MSVKKATNKQIIDWANCLVDNAPKVAGAQSQLTDGVRELIKEMIDRLSSHHTPP